MTDIAQVVSQLLPVVQQVVAGALMTGGSGFFGKLKEAGAISGFLTEAAEQFQGNSIIQGVISSISKGGDLLGDIDLNNLDLGAVMTQVGDIGGLLNSLGDEGGQIKQFIFGLAERIVGASGSGLFGSGEKVNPQEQDFLNNLRQTLGL